MPSLASKIASLAPAPLRDAASAAATHAAAAAVAATDSEWVPDAVLRAGIRALLKQRDGEVRYVFIDGLGEEVFYSPFPSPFALQFRCPVDA